MERVASIPTPSAYHPANFPDNLYSWSQRVSERKQSDEEGRRMPQVCMPRKKKRERRVGEGRERGGREERSRERKREREREE